MYIGLAIAYIVVGAVIGFYAARYEVRRITEQLNVWTSEDTANVGGGVVFGMFLWPAILIIVICVVLAKLIGRLLFKLGLIP